MAQRRSGVLLRRSFLIAVCFAWFGLGGGQQPVKAQCPEQIYSFTVGAYLGDGVPALSSKVTVGGARTVFAVGFPRLGGMIDRAELEIVTSAIYAPTVAKYDFYATTGLSYSDLTAGRKLASVILGPDTTSRVIKIPITPGDIKEKEGTGGEGILQVSGVLSEGGPDAYVIPIIGTLKLAVTETNVPVPDVATWGTLTVTAGQPLGFSASAKPCAAFQWQFNDRDIPGWISPTYYRPSALKEHEGKYSVVMRNSFGAVTSTVAHVIVQSAAPANSPDAVATNYLGGIWQYCFYTGAAPRGTVQWLHNSEVLPSETKDCISIPSLRADQAGVYTAIERNEYGTATNHVQLTVMESAPSIVGDPVDLTVVEGGTITFSFNAVGGPPPQIYLERNGTNWPLPGFTLFGATTNDTGLYRYIASNSLGTAVSKAVKLLVLPAGPLDQWTERNPLPQVNTVLSLAAGKGLTIGVGEMGTIVVSTNGKAWKVLDRLTEEDIHAVTFGAGRFVAVGQNGTLLHSADGEHWTRVFVESTDLRAVVYGNDAFIAVGDSGVYRSEDGVQWVKYKDILTGRPRGVAFGNGVFVTASRQSFWTSSNGLDWEPLQAPEELEGIAFLNGQFMAVGNDGTIMTSSNGRLWADQRSGTGLRLYDVAYGNGKYVTVGSRGLVLTSSNNGLIWEPVISGTPDRMEAIVFRDGLFVAAGENGTTITSTDGVTWTQEKRGTTQDLDGMVINDQRIVVVGKRGTILTSTNGVDFEERQSGTTNNLHGVAWAANNLYVAVGEPGVILTSPDAIEWTPRESGVTNSLKRAYFANNLWVAVGTEGTIVVSAEGTNWISLPRVTFDDLNDVAFGQGVFVVVGDNFIRPNGTILISTNGLSWVDTTVEVSKNVRSVTFADGRFMAAANDGQIIESTNGFAWAYHSPAQTGNLRDMHWENGLWMAVGNSGAIATPNTFNWWGSLLWTRRTTRGRENLHEVGYFKGRWITIGNRGTILQSGATRDPVLVTSFKPGHLIVHVVGSGKPSVIERSEDFSAWTVLAEFTAPDYYHNVTVSGQLGFPQRLYYRVRQFGEQSEDVRR